VKISWLRKAVILQKHAKKRANCSKSCENFGNFWLCEAKFLEKMEKNEKMKKKWEKNEKMKK
jgi:hypothetical protein